MCVFAFFPSFPPAIPQPRPWPPISPGAAPAHNVHRQHRTNVVCFPLSRRPSQSFTLALKTASPPLSRRPCRARHDQLARQLAVQLGATRATSSLRRCSFPNLRRTPPALRAPGRAPVDGEEHHLCRYRLAVWVSDLALLPLPLFVLFFPPTFAQIPLQ